MNTEKFSDDALYIRSPRLLTAAYFGMLAVIASVFVSVVFYILNFKQMLPIFVIIFLALGVGTLVGALFGQLIVYAKRPFRIKVYCYGFILVLLALAVYDLGFLALYYFFRDNNLAALSYNGIFALYSTLLLQSVLLVGFWLAVLGGFAAVYLRSCLVYVIMDSDDEHRFD